ncbi:MAG: hypothetical protein AB7N65_19225 [Vicinamibacterales bacterium]
MIGPMPASPHRLAALLLCLAAAAGCAGPSPAGPTVITENVAGTYTGNVSGVLPGLALAGTLTLTLQQSGSALSGGYTIAAPVNGGAQGAGSVTLTGTVTSGSNPTVSFTVRSMQCPAAPPSDWTGSFQSGNGRLTITGTIHLLNSSCVTQLSFPVTVVMSR